MTDFDPLVIIEGPDGAGKTTLAKAVHETLLDRGYVDASLTHLGPPKYDARKRMSFGNQAMRQVLETFAYNRHGGLVMDRGYWGEVVYAPIFRPEKCFDEFYGTMTEETFQWMVDLFINHDAVQVLCTNHIDTLVERLNIRADEALLAEDKIARYKQLERILEGYERIRKHFEDRGLSFVEVRLDRLGDTQEAAEMIVDLATDMETVNA